MGSFSKSFVTRVLFNLCKGLRCHVFLMRLEVSLIICSSLGTYL